MNTLTTKESVRLCELERIIQKGKETFVEVGTALAEIRDSKIYRNTFPTFEEYCRDRWGFSRVRAHQMIEAAQTSSVLTTVNKPTTERQARELTKAPPEKRESAMEKAQEIAKEEGKPLAARHVEKAVSESKPKEDPAPVIDDTPKDSEKLSLLKSTWTKASKKEKSAFAAWINKTWKI